MKKLLALTLSLILVVSTFSACGKTEEKNEGDTKETTELTQEENKKDPEPEEKPVNNDKEKYKEMFWLARPHPVVEKHFYESNLYGLKFPLVIEDFEAQLKDGYHLQWTASSGWNRASDIATFEELMAQKDCIDDPTGAKSIVVEIFKDGASDREMGLIMKCDNTNKPDGEEKKTVAQVIADNTFTIGAVIDDESLEDLLGMEELPVTDDSTIGYFDALVERIGTPDTIVYYPGENNEDTISFMADCLYDFGDFGLRIFFNSCCIDPSDPAHYTMESYHFEYQNEPNIMDRYEEYLADMDVDPEYKIFTYEEFQNALNAFYAS